MKPVLIRRSAWLLLLAVAACSGRTEVTRISPDETVDLSGFWNDSDSRMVADALIEDALSYPWSRRHQQQHGGELPAVIIGSVINRTSEHIAVNTFLRDLEGALMRSGEARIVADREQREQVREEREDQQRYASPESRARLRNELGADYIVVGEITSIEDIEGNREVIFYQVDLNMTDLESNERVWIGQHKIKKYVERRRTRR
ncbi:MAG: penicillin-binding protein activator LpoB [Gemmatimonadales bacterium]|nr:penicillin-binding protein activator LpoB [Gemmatimonadales bacterium]NIN12239.1 penicillin-binding protein activator LpoB [Gemmatimonadales bacterium]NIQ99362.1 penicillin-binding protein activator LpoB [Gemmatimonadales bacterium]NIS64043.1 penicillin-binding protein activator LpoB [Gemmatimonadales bacterium]